MQTIVKILLVISILLFSAYGIQRVQTHLDGYETRTVNVEVPYQEPIYKTLYSGTLTYSFLGINFDTPYQFENATSYGIKESWGLGTYSMRICKDSKCDSYLANSGFDTVQAYSSQIVIGNVTKYRIEPRDVTKKRWDWLLS